MKRLLAVFVTLILLLSMTLATGVAAESGDMLIHSDKVTGAVGDIIKVNFYLYPNLPEDRLLDSLTGVLKFDPEFLTLGAINLSDEEENLTSLLMSGKTHVPFYTNEPVPGELRFSFADGYGVEEEGFWFQAEFRIEKEGATEFIFNGITYTGLKTIKNDDGSTTYNTVTYTIDPLPAGGVYTEGESIPTGGAAEETFSPITPAVQTPTTVTPTPKPSNAGQPVPVTSTLPTYSANPSSVTGVVTPAPPVTSIPVKTPGPADETPAPSQGTETAPVSEVTPDTEVSPTDAVPPTDSETTTDPVAGEVIEVTSQPLPENDRSENTSKAEEETSSLTDVLLTVGIIVGIVAVVGLGVIAIILVLKRRKMNEQ